MGLLDKLKSLFGSDQNGQSPARGTEADVTVEHEPAAESEHAVKGTDAGRQQRGANQPQHGQSQQGQPQGHQSAGGQSTEHQTATGATPDGTGTEPESSTTTPEETPEPATEDADDEEADTATEDEPADSPSVEEIKGIGPTYAERLEGAGMGTVADLAAADPADVAEAAQTGENRAGDWVERAQEF